MSPSLASLSLEQVCGQLLVCGFAATTVPEPLLERLRAGERGGAILFRRNLPDLDTALELNETLTRACPPELPPFLGIDEEGGRVSRLPAPAVTLPPMRQFGLAAVVDLAHDAAAALGRQLAALGYNVNFAPVLDVDSNPTNPIIGDRSFSSEPLAVERLGIAFAAGLQAGGVLPCGKHFPGHGDTEVDSHLDLPVVRRDETSVRRVELSPFRAAIAAGLPLMMSAHVVFEAIDPDVPATLSSKLCTDLLRDELGFDGVLFSDDMEMKALADRLPIEDTAVRAIAAGCDALLICHSATWQERAHASLVVQAQKDEAFRQRCYEAFERNLRARLRCPPEPDSTAAAQAHAQELDALTTLLI